MGTLLLVVAWLTGPTLSLVTMIALTTGHGTDRLVKLYTHARSRLPRRGPSGPAVLGRPIERIGSDARRLGHQLRLEGNGRSQVRITAIRRAYDDVLAEGCAALGVPELLGVLPDGAELDYERRRVEVVLAGAGMVLEDVY